MSATDHGGTDEPDLVAAILRGDPTVSRNRNYELLSSEIGRRARRRAAFLRSIARDIETARRDRGAVVIERGTERGAFARNRVRVVIHHEAFTRRAYLTEDEMTLVAQAFPLAARVLDVAAAE